MSVSCVCCCRWALSQTCDKCHLSGGFDTWAGLKVGLGGCEKSGVHTSSTVGDDPVTNFSMHTSSHLKSTEQSMGIYQVLAYSFLIYDCQPFSIAHHTISDVQQLVSINWSIHYRKKMFKSLYPLLYSHRNAAV